MAGAFEETLQNETNGKAEVVEDVKK